MPLVCLEFEFDFEEEEELLLPEEVVVVKKEEKVVSGLDKPPSLGVLLPVMVMKSLNLRLLSVCHPPTSTTSSITS